MNKNTVVKNLDFFKTNLEFHDQTILVSVLLITRSNYAMRSHISLRELGIITWNLDSQTIEETKLDMN